MTPTRENCSANRRFSFARGVVKKAHKGIGRLIPTCRNVRCESSSAHIVGVFFLERLTLFPKADERSVIKIVTDLGGAAMVPRPNLFH